MNDNLPQKELIIAVIGKDDSVLMRKKPQDSLPYKETWYLFGCEPVPNQDNPTTIKNYLKSELGIDVEVSSELLPPDFEIKQDHDGIEKNFVYTNLKCHYLGGNSKTPKGAERVEWISKDKLSEYDLVPPSRRLLKAMGYLSN